MTSAIITSTGFTKIGDDDDDDISPTAPVMAPLATAASDATTAPSDSFCKNDGNLNDNDNNHLNDNDVDSIEKLTRRLFNKHLKQRNKLRKYETRMQQAIIRKDKALEESARRDWEEYNQRLKDDPNSVVNYSVANKAESLSSIATSTSIKSTCCQLNQSSRFRHLHPTLRSSEERETKRVRDGSEWLLEFWKQLAPRIISSSPNNNNNNNKYNDPESNTAITAKQQQTKHAAILKGNMQRGTQTESMFADELAILGYTRQKFYERAVLAFNSLDRLDPCYGNNNDNNADGNDDDDDDEDNDSEKSDNGLLMRCIWERLMSTKQLISIGCGPGCDATGILGFLESHNVQLENGILFMDFVISQWKRLVLDKLIPMISPQYVPSGTVKTVCCDVRYSILLKKGEDQNSSSNNNINASAASELIEQPSNNSNRNNRLIVVSYLLTETRHKWKSFFRDLLSSLQGTQSLLLLTEPMAWQLHEFLKCFSTEDTNFVKTHVWLDSSRDLPHLQTLDKRNGPAILLVCTN